MELKSENKNTTNEYGYFIESNFSGVSNLFVLVYLIPHNDVKRNEARRFYLPNDTIKNYNVINNWKNFHDEAINSDVKQSEEIRKCRCLLDHDYIKDKHRSIAVDLSRRKELDADPKVIHQIEFVG